MANEKSMRLARENKYELLLLFDRFRGFKVKVIFDKLNERRPGYVTLKTLYNYHHRYKRAERRLGELTKGW